MYVLQDRISCLLLEAAAGVAVGPGCLPSQALNGNILGEGDVKGMYDFLEGVHLNDGHPVGGKSYKKKIAMIP